jgi:hypothetical protein
MYKMTTIHLDYKKRGSGLGKIKMYHVGWVVVPVRLKAMDFLNFGLVKRK